MATNYVYVLFTCLLFCIVRAFPSGAPPNACSSMTPGHRDTTTNILIMARNTPSPFNVTTVVNGRMVTVTVDGDPQYRGILLQARPDADGEPMGMWSVPEGGDFKNLDCGQEMNALTHTSRNDKTLPQAFTWNAPVVEQATEFIILVTVVQQYDNFHVRIPSAPFTIQPENAPETATIKIIDITAPTLKANATYSPGTMKPEQESSGNEPDSQNATIPGPQMSESTTSTISPTSGESQRAATVMVYCLLPVLSIIVHYLTL